MLISKIIQRLRKKPEFETTVSLSRPIYLYRCRICGHEQKLPLCLVEDCRFIQSIYDNRMPVMDCPKCGEYSFHYEYP